MAGKNPGKATLARAVLHITDRWQEGKSLKEIAHLHSVDEGNLVRTFRKAHGITPRKYINKRRIGHVMARLSANHVAGYELADELGFPTDISFYRWTKRTTGMSFIRLRQRVQRKTGTLTGANDKKKRQ